MSICRLLLPAGRVVPGANRLATYERISQICCVKSLFCHVLIYVFDLFSDMGGCTSAALRTPREKRYRRAIKLYEVGEVKSLTNLFNRNKCFDTGELPVTLAAHQGHEAVVQALIRGGADANKLDKNGKGALHIAVYLNDLETADIILASKVDLDKYDGNNMTPLHIACERGSKMIAARLLVAGANPNECSIALPPLIHAVVHGHSECVEVLLKYGADPDVYDSRSNSALCIAVSNSDIVSTRALLKNGASPNHTSRDHVTLTCLASVIGSAGMLQTLIENGCDPNFYREDDVPPLIAAAAKANCDCVDILINAGVDVEITDKKGHGALYNAAIGLVDMEKNLFYCKYFSNVYRNFSKYDPLDIYPENATKCVMSLVQAGADLTSVWERFTQVCPHPEGVTFEQMVLCEVLIQAYGFHKLSLAKRKAFSVNLLTLREYGLVKLLYSAGVEPDAEDLYTLSVRGEEMDRFMFKWVKRLRFSPRQLKDLCRKTVRQTLSWNVLYNVEKLDIPGELKEYICIMDTEHYSKVDES